MPPLGRWGNPKGDWHVAFHMARAPFSTSVVLRQMCSPPPLLFFSSPHFLQHSWFVPLLTASPVVATTFRRRGVAVPCVTSNLASRTPLGKNGSRRVQDGVTIAVHRCCTKYSMLVLKPSFLMRTSLRVCQERFLKEYRGLLVVLC